MKVFKKKVLFVFLLILFVIIAVNVYFQFFYSETVFRENEYSSLGKDSVTLKYKFVCFPLYVVSFGGKFSFLLPNYKLGQKYIYKEIDLYHHEDGSLFEKHIYISSPSLKSIFSRHLKKNIVYTYSENEIVKAVTDYLSYNDNMKSKKISGELKHFNQFDNIEKKLKIYKNNKLISSFYSYEYLLLKKHLSSKLRYHFVRDLIHKYEYSIYDEKNILNDPDFIRLLSLKNCDIKELPESDKIIKIIEWVGDSYKENVITLLFYSIEDMDNDFLNTKMIKYLTELDLKTDIGFFITALLLYKQEDYDNSLSYYKQLLIRSYKQGNYSHMITILNNMGCIYYNQNRMDDAALFFLSSIIIYKRNYHSDYYKNISEIRSISFLNLRSILYPYYKIKYYSSYYYFLHSESSIKDISNNNKLVLISDSLLYEKNDYKVENHMDQINKILYLINKLENQINEYHIYGHSSPDEKSDISKLRSEILKKYFNEKVKADIKIFNFKDDEPILPNETEEGRSKNRRCEIYAVVDDPGDIIDYIYENYIDKR